MASHTTTTDSLNTDSLNTDSLNTADSRANLAQVGARHDPAQRRLARALFADAEFTAVVGIASTLLAGPLSDRMGIATWLPITVGLGLVGWAAMLVALSRSPRLSRRDGRLIAAGGEAWIIASLAIAIAGPGGLTGFGRWLLIVLCIPVGALATWQWLTARDVAPVHSGDTAQTA